MRYIRTECGVYDTEDAWGKEYTIINGTGLRITYLGVSYKDTPLTRVEQIVKQSEDLCELSDWFVSENDEYCTLYSKLSLLLEDDKYIEHYDEYGFYAMAWFKGKGFIYFAKVRDDGGLKLI